MRVLFTVTAAAGLAASASAQTVTNGDFETGTLLPWVFTPDANGEPLMVATVAPFQSSQTFRVNPGHDGSGGSAGGDLTQQVTLTAGSVYTVSGDLFIENIRLTGSNANGGTITVSINGQQVHTWTVTEIPALTTIPGPFSVSYTASASGPQPLTLRFTRTFRNSTPSIYHWADNLSITGGGPAPCYPNCDHSTIAPILNVQDFGCFLNAFAAGESYANCDGSTTPPILNVQDFGCFLNAFAAGCP
jgi:hypothetical protein